MRKVFIFIMLCLSTSIYAQHRHSDKSVEGIFYNFSDEGAEVTYSHSGFRYTGNIVIPGTVDYGGATYPVIRIGDHAFRNCNELTSVSIPNSVKEIGNRAFYGCSDLASFFIPASVSYMRGNALDSCASLVSIEVENGNENFSSENGVLFNKDKTTLIRFPQKKTGMYVIPEGVTNFNTAFYGCCLSSIVIPNSVKFIVNKAFEHCINLTSVTIPASVTSIGNNAFYGCSNLNSVVIPPEVKRIEHGTFNGCSALASIVLPEGLTAIEYDAFENCSNLASITIPESVTKIEQHAFYGCSNLTFISIPPNITNIENELFYGCISLTSIAIPAGVTQISNAFENCDKLASINMESENKNFSSHDGVLFNKDKSTLICYPAGKTGSSFVIPEGVTTIGSDAFDDCSTLTSITIPASVKSISSTAFDGCSGLTSILCLSPNPPNLSSAAFQDVIADACTLKVPTNAISRYKNGWTKLNIVDCGYPVYLVRAVDKSGKEIIKTYKKGNATATITADAGDNKEFEYWTNGKKKVSTDNPYSFTVTGDVELVANFKIRQ